MYLLCVDPTRTSIQIQLSEKLILQLRKFFMKLVVHRRMEVLDIQHTVVRTIENEELSDEELSDLELDELPNPEGLKDIDDASLVF